MTEILRFRDVERITKMSRATLYRKIKSGELSKPVPINGSPYVVGWHPQVVEDFVQRCLSTPSPENLVSAANSARRLAAAISVQKRRDHSHEPVAA